VYKTESLTVINGYQGRRQLYGAGLSLRLSCRVILVQHHTRELEGGLHIRPINLAVLPIRGGFISRIFLDHRGSQFTFLHNLVDRQPLCALVQQPDLDAHRRQPAHRALRLFLFDEQNSSAWRGCDIRQPGSSMQL
jgi:hypothetical protein